MGWQTAIATISSESSNITLVEPHEGRRWPRNVDIRLKPRTNRGCTTSSLAETMTGTHCSVWNCLERTALTISFVRQMAKVDIRETCAEPREDGETSSQCERDGRGRCG